MDVDVDRCLDDDRSKERRLYRMENVCGHCVCEVEKEGQETSVRECEEEKVRVDE